jgi:hypothetical protein
MIRWPASSLANVQLERRAVDLVGHLGQVVACGRDIHQHQGGTVAVEGPGDRCADAARCAGDNGNLVLPAVS